MSKKGTALTKAGAATPEVLPAIVNEQIEITGQVGDALAELKARARAFFLTARTLEDSAQAELVAVKALPKPTTAEEDEAIVRRAKRVNVAKKAIEDHWGITSVISQFHKLLTGTRKRGVDYTVEAKGILDRLHNEYTENAKRAAEREQRRLDDEAAARARQVQEAEAAELEAQAIAAEEASAELSDREQRFVEFVVVFNADPIAAARQVGYKDPVAVSQRLMASSKVQTAIAKRREAIALRQQADAVRQAPVDVGEVEQVKPDIRRTPGAHDRTTWSAQVINEAAFIEAVFAGELGIPRDVLMINPKRLNELARELHERMNRWPGVKATSNTSIV